MTTTLKTGSFYKLNGGVFDNSTNGYHGTLVGNGPNINVADGLNAGVTMDGNGACWNFTDVDYFTISPNVMTGLQYSGIYVLDFLIPYDHQPTAGGSVLFSCTTANGDFRLQLNSSQQFSLSIPTSTGSALTYNNQQAVVANAIWYRLTLTWDSGGVDLKIKDMVTYIESTVFTERPMADGATPSISIPTSQISIGAYPGNFGRYCRFQFGRFGFFQTTDDITNIFPVTKRQRIFASYGNSIVFGDKGDGYIVDSVFSLSCDGYRLGFLKRTVQLNAPYYFYGSFANTMYRSIKLCPFSEGVSGQSSTEMAALITASGLATKFPNPNSYQNIIFGIMLTNDDWRGVSDSQTRTNIRSAFDTVYNYSPLINMFVFNEIDSALQDTITAMPRLNAALTDEYNRAKGLGYNIWMFDQQKENPTVQIGSDDLHPGVDGYLTMGTYYMNKIYSILGD
jgi:hypothetical protein